MLTRPFAVCAERLDAERSSGDERAVFHGHGAGPVPLHVTPPLPTLPLPRDSEAGPRRRGGTAAAAARPFA